MRKAFLVFCFTLLSFAVAFAFFKNAMTTAHVKKYCSRYSDISEVLQRLVDKYDTVIIDRGVWVVSKPIVLRSGVVIKGVSKKKSIIKVSTQAIIDGDRKFCLFTTSIPKALFGEEYMSFSPESYRTKLFNDISISNLTIDVNRHPDFFFKKGVSALVAELNIVRFENCKNCRVDNCIIKDYCTPASCNNSAVVALVESDSCYVENCISNNCTFVLSLGGKRNVFNANVGKNSVGTWIETVGGRDHIITNNCLNNVYDYVSSIGINSIGCKIIHNRVVNDSGTEISCLTLGHPQEEKSYALNERSNLPVKADSCIVENNHFDTSAHVAVLIQNGSSIVVDNNYMSSAPEMENYAHACLYVHGQRDNLYSLIVSNNTFNVSSRKGSVICGDCLNDAIIESNTITTTCRYAIRLGRPTTTVEIRDNEINVTDGEVISADSVETLYVSNNHFKGGYLNLHYSQLLFDDNKWDEITASSRFELIEAADSSIDYITRVNNNSFKLSDGVHLNQMIRLFSSSVESETRKISGNEYNHDGVKTFLY